jgi:hypothetical protein
LVDHHWIQYRKEDIFVPDLNKFGFVYLITNLQNGKGYVGCKQYLMYRRMKETESDWKTYMGSSKWLTKDIEKIGKEHFKFEISSIVLLRAIKILNIERNCLKL